MASPVQRGHTRNSPCSLPSSLQLPVRRRVISDACSCLTRHQLIGSQSQGLSCVPGVSRRVSEGANFEGGARGRALEEKGK